MAHPMRVSLRTGIAAAVLVLLALLQGTALGAARTVTISGFAFSPVTTVVAAGDTITWHNSDATPHTATSNNGAFDTGPIAAGTDGKTVTFAVAGTFTYHCSIHPSMTGTITVQAAATPPPTTLPPTPAPTAPLTAAPTATPAPASTPSPSPTAAPMGTPTLAPLATIATAAPTRVPTDAPAPARIPDGGGTPLAAAITLVAVALAGFAIYLYRRR